MELESQADTVVDSVQLRRIEATHKGFLYQHLYGVACVLMSGRSGWSRLMIEFNEDVELRYPDRHVYVQVKTRSRLVKPGDVASALQRFERYREIHDAQRRKGRAEFVLALNSDPSPVLSACIAAGDMPSDVRTVWPGYAVEGLPPPWATVDEAFTWCVDQAATLPFLMVAPDVLVLKLAGLMVRIASGTGEYSSHAITAEQAAGMLEQFVHQLHEFPAPPLNYKPQDQEPALTTNESIRLIVGFSGAGKTSWAAHAAMGDGLFSTYIDVADLPSASVPAALARELAARWLHGDIDALRAVERVALSGVESLLASSQALATHHNTYTVVIDNAHRLAIDDARAISSALKGLRSVFLAQPTNELNQLCTALAVEPETLGGWGDDTIAAEANAAGCESSLPTVVWLKRLTAGLPLYVRSAIQVAANDYSGDLSAFCEALESQTLVSDTKQHTILARVFDGLDAKLKSVLECASLADVPLAAEELVTITHAAFGFDRRAVIGSLRALRSSGLLQAYGSQRSKTHDALRPVALEHLATDVGAERRAKEALLKLLEVSLEHGQEQGQERLPLFVRMLVELRRIGELADLATEEIFHELGPFPAVWSLLEEAADDESVSAETRCESIDALLYYRQRNGPEDAVAPLLAKMEALLPARLDDPRALIVFLQKKVHHLAEQGDEQGVHDLLCRVEGLLPNSDSHRRIFEYNAALALWKISRFDLADRRLQAVMKDYLRALRLDVEALMSDPSQYVDRVRKDDSYADGCKKLADCYDLLARVVEARRRPAGAIRAIAIRLFEITGHWDSAARVCIDLVWQHIDKGEPQRARKLLEPYLLTLVTKYMLNDRVIPVRYLYAHVLGKTGDVEAARKELRAIDPYLTSLPPMEQADARNLTAFLR